MAEQNLLPEQVIEKKRVAWGNLGVAVHNAEIALQLKQQAIIKLLVAPTKTDQLPAAEETLKLAKKQLEQLEEDRKKVTSKFEGVTKRLMKPEKEVDATIATFATTIINLKKQAEKDEKKLKQINDELNAIAAKVRLYIAEINASYLSEHAKLINDSYVYALEKIHPDTKDEYLAKLKARITIAKRTMPPPVYKAVVATQADVDDEIAKVFKPITAQEYIDGFVKDLEAKYSDYKLAWDNKEQALKLNEQEAIDNASAIEQQKQHDTVAANIQALVQTPVVGFTGKRLKEVYKLAMDETFEHANIICTAYLANTQKCREKLQITKWLTGFGVKQMISALEKIKNDDEKFNFDGLIWTTEDKL